MTSMPEKVSENLSPSGGENKLAEPERSRSRLAKGSGLILFPRGNGLDGSTRKEVHRREGVGARERSYALASLRNPAENRMRVGPAPGVKGRESRPVKAALGREVWTHAAAPTRPSDTTVPGHVGQPLPGLIKGAPVIAITTPIQGEPSSTIRDRGP